MIGTATGVALAVDQCLSAGLAALGRLATGQLHLPDILTSVAGYSVQAVPGAEGAGLTLVEDNHADTIVATADFVRQVDGSQYSRGEGPCISAAQEARAFASGSLGGEPRRRGSERASPDSACTACCRCHYSPDLLLLVTRLITSSRPSAPRQATPKLCQSQPKFHGTPVAHR